MGDSLCGQIVMKAFDQTIRDWIIPQGQFFPPVELSELYQVLGDRFGSTSNPQTFTLPNLAPINGVDYLMQSVDLGDIEYSVAGEIMLWPGNVEKDIPNGWLPCNGQYVGISDYQLLFLTMATRFGVKPIANPTSFALPKLTAPIANTTFLIKAIGENPTNMWGYVGMIKWFPTLKVRDEQFLQGWIKCDGSSIPTKDVFTTYLFDLIGYQYGGSGNNFNLPNIPDLCPGISAYICCQGRPLPNG